MPTIIDLPCTAFKRYGTKRAYELDSIEIHSIGTAQSDAKVIRNNMNQYSPGGITHAICDCKLAGTVYTLLPKDNVAWADAGYGNNHSYTIEMAESGYMKYVSGANFTITNEAKFKADIKRGYDTMVQYVAQLCREFGFDPTHKLPNGLHRVYSHDEARQKGLASAHVDVSHLWPKIDKNMDKFRAEVKAIMSTQVQEVEVTQYWYRVRKTWPDRDSQIGAYANLDKAIEDCPAGYSVFDMDGKSVYTNTAKVYASGVPASKQAFIDAVSDIAIELYAETKILPSVVIAQCCLESGYGLGTDNLPLTKVSNILGMKTDLINNTWKDYTVWNGKTVMKVTPEEYNGVTRMVNASFRVYTDYKNCIQDYERFLLYVKNNSGYKYRAVQGKTDPKEVITIISKGGYATDSSYITKIMRVINENNFTKYDKAVLGTESAENTQKAASDSEKTTVSEKLYRVQAGSYSLKANATKMVNKISQKAELLSYVEREGEQYKVYCGTFSIKSNATKRVKELAAAGIKAIIKEV